MRLPRVLLLVLGCTVAALLYEAVVGRRRPLAADDQPAARLGAPDTAPRPDSAGVRDTLAQIVRSLGLDAGLRPGCYIIEIDPGAAPVTADVREVHDARCGGDPNTAPRITSLQWDPTTGAVITDYWGLPEGRVDTLPADRRVPPTARGP